MPLTQSEIVVGLDIGTTKVGTVIASGDGAGGIAVIGVGIVPSRGIKRGVVVDVEDTVAAIKDSVERAAHMAGVKVERAVVGITGDHIQSSNRRGTVTVASRSGHILRHDVERVLQAATLEIPKDREIIHSLPRDFIVDGHPGVKRPVGMVGQRLEVETHIVTGRATFLQNTVQCVEKSGLTVEALVLEPIATAEAVTTPDERDMGVILIDIGGGTSDIAVFVDGSIIYSGVLPVGGNHVTRDIAIGLRTPFELAERLKLDSGAATRGMIPHGEAFEVIMAGSGEKLRIPRSLLGEIIEARMSELFELAREMMHYSGVKKRLPAGVIVAGGGSLLPGAIELGMEVFQMPTRMGIPRDISGWSEQVATPQLATGVGLCRFALKQRVSPGNQTEIPALASANERRVWGGMSDAPQVQTPAPRAALIGEAAPKATPFIAPVPEVARDVIAEENQWNEPTPQIEPESFSSASSENLSATNWQETPFDQEVVEVVEEEEEFTPYIPPVAQTVPAPIEPPKATQETPVSSPDALTELRQNLAHRDSAFRKLSEEKTTSGTPSFEERPAGHKTRDELFSRADLKWPQREPDPPSFWGNIWMELKKFLGFEEERKDH